MSGNGSRRPHRRRENVSEQRSRGHRLGPGGPATSPGHRGRGGADFADDDFALQPYHGACCQFCGDSCVPGPSFFRASAIHDSSSFESCNVLAVFLRTLYAAMIECIARSTGAFVAGLKQRGLPTGEKTSTRRRSLRRLAAQSILRKYSRISLRTTRRIRRITVDLARSPTAGVLRFARGRGTVAAIVVFGGRPVPVSR